MKVDIPEKEQNVHAPNAATWHKWGYLMFKIFVIELKWKVTELICEPTKPFFPFCETIKWET
jgi:hypothetical protein